jgi:hypothetical protein
MRFSTESLQRQGRCRQHMGGGKATYWTSGGSSQGGRRHGGVAEPTLCRHLDRPTIHLAGKVAVSSWCHLPAVMCQRVGDVPHAGHTAAYNGGAGWTASMVPQMGSSNILQPSGLYVQPIDGVIFCAKSMERALHYSYSESFMPPAAVRFSTYVDYSYSLKTDGARSRSLFPLSNLP